MTRLENILVSLAIIVVIIGSSMLAMAADKVVVVPLMKSTKQIHKFIVTVFGTITDTETGLMWQQADDGIYRTLSEAYTFCDQFTLGDYEDWRLPSKGELKNLVVCTNGTETPLVDHPGHPYWCGDGNDTEFDSPTIYKQFSCTPFLYWTSSIYDLNNVWIVEFVFGNAIWFERNQNGLVRCVR